MFLRSFLALCVAFIAAAPAHAQDANLSAQDIVDRALDTDTIGFQTGAATMSLIIQDASGETRERRMDVRGMREGDANRSIVRVSACLLYTSPSPRDRTRSRMPSSA